jgi:peptidoglycan/xylan/chitin deacetylase (PgdA/CDA1 family)
VALAARPLVLCYHGVSDSWEHSLAVRPAALERQVASLLRRGYRPATALDTVGARAKLLHVTFDDAYRNVASAVPILQRLGVPATVFACSSYADDGRALAVPELADEAAANPGHMATMSWNELRALAENGVEIGSHTVSHPHLPQLADDELDRELGQARERIESELGRPCPLLAYPYGEADGRVASAARRAGYAAAFTLTRDADPGNPFLLPRLDLYRRDGLLRTTLKTSSIRRPVSALLDAVHGRGR